MLPISEINIGDQFENPVHRPWGLAFIVLDINQDEKMVKVIAFDRTTQKNVREPFWKKNTDRMFCESWRVFNMEKFLNK